MGDWAKTIALLVVIVTAGKLAGEFSSLTPSQSQPASQITLPNAAVIHEISDCAVIRLSPGTAVLIGSLDQTAQQHVVRLVWQPDNSRGRTPAPFLTSRRAGLSVPEHWSLPVTMPMPTCAVSNTDSPTDEFQSADDIVVVYPRSGEPRTRRFAVPFFGVQMVHDRHVLATEIATGDRVSVYLVDEDQSVFDGRPRKSREIATDIIRRAEARVLKFVEQRLGPVTDLDHDGRLTFVLSRLSSGSATQRLQQPIMGCVRPDDFLPGPAIGFADHTGGDIIYLDCTLPAGKELDAVLAHELAHAATFSAINDGACNQTARLPGWLNEAIAHYIELQINPASDNLKRRLIDFTRQPHRFPLIIPDSVHCLSLRRGPARAAACLFLTCVLERLPAGKLRSLVCRPQSGTGRLEFITEDSFSEIFRNWGLHLMASDRDFPRHHLPAFDDVNLHLAATAFTWTEPVTEHGTLQVHAPPESLLQITIVQDKAIRTATAGSAEQH